MQRLAASPKATLSRPLNFAKYTICALLPSVVLGAANAANARKVALLASSGVVQRKAAMSADCDFDQLQILRLQRKSAMTGRGAE